MATEKLIIAVSSTGEKVVQRNLQDIGAAADKTTDSVSFLKKALGAIGVGILVNELKKYLDINTQISNKLKLLTNSTEELEAVQKRLAQTAIQTRTAYENTAAVFARMSFASKELGANQETTLRVVELLNKTISLSGSTSLEAAAGLQQFAQAIASGRLQGDELRSVLENLPGLATQLAKGLGITRGELRQLGTEGKLTPSIILNALLKMGSEIDAQFSKTVPTISQGLEIINTKLIVFLNELDKSYHISQFFGEKLKFVSDNFTTLIEAMGVFTTFVVTAFIPAMLRASVSMGVFVAELLIANPISAVIALITAAVAAYDIFGSKINEVKDYLSKHKAVLVSLQIAFAIFVGVVASLIPPLLASFVSLGTAISLFVANSIKSFALFIAANPFTLFIAILASATAAFLLFSDEILKSNKELINDIIKGFKGLELIISTAFQQVAISVSSIWDGVINKIITGSESAINAIIKLTNKIPGVTQISPVSLSNREASSSKNAQDELDKNLLNGLSNITKTDYVGDYLKDQNKKADGLASIKEKVVDLGKVEPFKDKNIKASAEEIKKLENEWKKLLNTIDPTDAAQRDFTKGQETLNKVLQSGAITIDQYNKYTILMRDHFNELINPYQHLTDEIKKEIKFSELNNREKDVQIALDKDILDLKSKGIILTGRQSTELEQLIRLQQEATNPSPLNAYAKSLTDTGDLIQESLVTGMKDAADSLAEFLLEGKSGLTDFGSTLKNIAKQLASFVIQQSLFRPLATQFGSFLGSSFGFADGGVFQNGSVKAFANGGIVGAPTLFPMASGNVGLMGEAGAEAIVPLRRLNNGRLGIESSGGKSSNFAPIINISVNNSGGGGESGDQSLAMKIASQVKTSVENTMADFINRQQRPGGQLSSSGVM